MIIPKDMDRDGFRLGKLSVLSYFFLGKARWFTHPGSFKQAFVITQEEIKIVGAPANSKQKLFFVIQIYIACMCQNQEGYFHCDWRPHLVWPNVHIDNIWSDFMARKFTFIRVCLSFDCYCQYSNIIASFRKVTDFLPFTVVCVCVYLNFFSNCFNFIY